MGLIKALGLLFLEERDSLYYYLKNDDNVNSNTVNSRREFDPYLKEERYKALLRKHYLPITHWNE